LRLSASTTLLQDASYLTKAHTANTAANSASKFDDKKVSEEKKMNYEGNSQAATTHPQSCTVAAQLLCKSRSGTKSNLGFSLKSIEGV